MLTAHLSKREKIIVLIVSGLVCLFLIYNFLFAPMFNKIAALNQNIAKTELRLRKDLGILNQEKNISKDYQSFSEVIRLKAPEEQEMAKILSEIEGVAQGINIRILDMKPKKIRPIDFYKDFSVDLVIDGQINDIIHFIYNLQSLPHLIKVEKLRIEKESVLQPTLKANLTVSKVLIP